MSRIVDGTPQLEADVPLGQVDLRRVKSIAMEPLPLPPAEKIFQTMRDDGHRVFGTKDLDGWLAEQLEPHTLEVGDTDVHGEVAAMKKLNGTDAQLQMRRALEVQRKIEEARAVINKYRQEGQEASAELQWRLREEEVSARERVTFEHQAHEAELLQRMRAKEGLLQRVPHQPFTWTVEWMNAPQEFTVNVTSIRGLRNKVRDGYYVLLCSVVDRVGGSCFRFSTGERNKDCNGALPPLRFKSKSSNVDTFIDKSVSLSCPAPALIGTHAALLFELWQLRVGKYDPVDKVVGFGYWPLVDRNHRVVEGKFTVPMIVGEADPAVDTYRQMTRLVESGLQYWLGNLYFEIRHDRRKADDGSGADGAVYGAAGEVMEEAGAALRRLGMAAGAYSPEALRMAKTADDIRQLSFPQLPPRLFFDDVKISQELTAARGSGLRSGTAGAAEGGRLHGEVHAIGQDADLTRRPETSDTHRSDGTMRRREEEVDPISHLSREAAEMRDMNNALWQKRAQLEQEKTELMEEDATRRKRRGGASVEGMSDEELQRLEARIRKELAMKKSTKHRMTTEPLGLNEEEKKTRDCHVVLEQHHHALMSQREFFFMGRRAREKASVAWAVVRDDLGYNAGGPFDKTKAVMSLFFFVLGLLGRMLAHGIGKYLWLMASHVALTKEGWYFYNIDLRFDFTTAVFYPYMSALTAIVPNLAVVAVFSILALVLYALLRIFDRLPYALTRFCFWMGVAAVLDAVICLIAEAASGNYDCGEPFLLYHQFATEERTGIHGVILTVVVYFTIAVPQAYFLFLYAVYVHLNGRAEDIYTRITFPESSFFIPCDMELSKAELDDVVTKAKNYRGENADIKRVTVKDFNHKFTCHFRERLFKLMTVLSNDPDEWVTQYFQRISIRRPRYASRHIRDNLGRFRLGSDIMLFMRRNFPAMCVSSGGIVGDRAEDFYYEAETIRGMTSHSTAQEDEKEMRDFLRCYFVAQVADTKPAEWSVDDPLTFIVKDAALLADLIFFETDGHDARVRLLKKYLEPHCSRDILSADPVIEDSWVEVHLPNFYSSDMDQSTQGEDAVSVIILVSLENAVKNTSHLLRAFVVTPFGQILEPTAACFTFLSAHTADFPEFWAAKAVQEARNLNNMSHSYGLQLR